MTIISIEVPMILNPHFALITVSPPDNVEFFHLKYLKAGVTVAELVQAANYNTNSDFVQDLQPLNALVPADSQATDLNLVVRSGNSGGESSGQAAASEVIQVENPPSTPSSVVVS